MDKLTLRQRKFIKYYLETGNASQSALKAGYKKRQSAFDFLSNPVILGKIEKLKEKAGLTDDLLLKKHLQLLQAKRLHVCDIYIKKENGKFVINRNSNDFIEVEDNQTQLGALKLAYEISGRIKHPAEPPPPNISVFMQNIYKKAGLINDSTGIDRSEHPESKNRLGEL